ncbi:glutaredoxin [Aestuariibacter sp. AA17]|uniref:Methylamine utilization protein MauE n=1 Tax=Fluctibacter corallii TaxID=2984329 RepID=A0ABT3A953_9ALTE|nr:glutaredoxin [Aestuariibacter sp. AA17]MCV2885198.1 glutaredoxin [Aestuariibacter sp. AA17]
MQQVAVLYRMVTDEHVCPFGIKSKHLLEEQGYDVEDHHLTNREETDRFKEKHDVKTTPQTFINDQRVGGYDELRQHFGKQTEQEKVSRYRPVLVVFAIAFLLSVGSQLAFMSGLSFEKTVFMFVGFTMTLLALQKLQDVVSFSNQFLGYDLLAQRYVPYAYVYPYAEAYTGIGMISGLPAWSVAPIGLFIGMIGAISVFKAVYVDKRELKCACVGGNSDVPLGFISLSENLFMVGAAVYMLWKWM